MPRLLAAALFAAALAAAVSADETSDRQKKVAAENLKKAGLAGVQPAETPGLIVCTTLPPARAKALADGLQKVHDLARKTLDYGAEEQPWKGKLTVYALTDPRQYRLLVLNTEQRRVESGERASYSLRTDDPHVALATDLPEKANDGDMLLEFGPGVAAALMTAKGGAKEYPDWLRVGFGKAVTLKTDGNKRRLDDYKAKARPLVIGGAGRAAATVADAATGGKGTPELLATSLAEYLAFGPGKPNFAKFLAGFKPTETMDMPGVDVALEAAGWKADALETAWAKWVRTGK